MSRVIWVFGLFVLLLWSLGVWALAFMFMSGADFLAAQAESWSSLYPEVQLTVSSVSAFLAHYGTAAVWFVWTMGGVIILFCTWLAVQIGNWLRRALETAAPQAGKALDAVRQRLGTGTPVG